MEKMKPAIIELLNRMDSIAARHPGIEDTMVREAMSMALYHPLIEGRRRRAPFFYWTLNPLANLRIRRALGRFLAHPDVRSFVYGSQGEEERQEAMRALLQDDTLVSRDGTTFDEYFGEY